MAGVMGLSRDDAVRIHSCLQEASGAANKHVRTVIEYGGKKFTVVVYEARDLPKIAAERAPAG